MICPYCGYEYDDKEPKCPFCGTENTGVAREQQRAVIHTLEEESRDIRQNLPRELLTDASKKTAGIFGKVILAVLVLIIATIAGSAAFRVYRTVSTESRLQKLDEYLSAGDYASLKEYMDDIDSYDSVYDKYWEVSFAYGYLSYAEEDLNWFYDNQGSPYSDHDMLAEPLAYAIGDCLNAHSHCTECIDDQLMLENETALEDIRSRANNILTQTLHLTEEEIEEMLELESYYEVEPLIPYAELSLERME